MSWKPFLVLFLSIQTSVAWSQQCSEVLDAFPDRIRYEFSVDRPMSKKMYKKLRDVAKEVSDLARDEIQLRSALKISLATDGSYASIFKSTVRLNIYSDRPDFVLGHEMGHHLFAEMLRQRSPEIYSQYKRISEDRVNGLITAAEFSRYDFRINSYAELFSDLVGMLASGKTAMRGESPWDRSSSLRDFTNTRPAPWQTDRPQDNYDRSYALGEIQYYRFNETRQFIWNSYQKFATGSLKKRRKLMLRTLYAMIDEIAQNGKTPISDRDANQNLMGRIAAYMQEKPEN